MVLEPFFFFLLSRYDVQTMIFISVIIVILCLCSFRVNSSDDSFEILSVNTGEMATFLCDIPERYSSQTVSCSHRSSIVFNEIVNREIDLSFLFNLFFQVDFYGPGGRSLGRKTGENLSQRYTLEHTYMTIAPIKENIKLNVVYFSVMLGHGV